MKRLEDEFAIDTATEQYVTRRQFSKFLVLTSLGMFAGNLWILVKLVSTPGGLHRTLHRRHE